jgi:hypothetical protein
VNKLNFDNIKTHGTNVKISESGFYQDTSLIPVNCCP